MTKLSSFVLGLILAFTVSASAQTINKATIFLSKKTGQVKNIKLVVNNCTFFISSTGSLSYYFDDNYEGDYVRRPTDAGTEDYGDVQYYDRFERGEKIGKVKKGGGLLIDYYDAFDREEKLGKVKSIGGIKIDYYDVFDRDEKLGKIKAIGNISLDYYTMFDADEKLGKLKSAGKVMVDYFDGFDGRLAG